MVNSIEMKKGVDMDFFEKSYNQRLRESISIAWMIFAEKVGSGLIEINKEASMQLQYSNILNQLLPLIRFKKSENPSIELETGVEVNGQQREIDLMLNDDHENPKFSIAVEMKCYREFASSGGKRGATDIFMKDVYEDLQLLELYCKNGKANLGVELIMNDLERLIHPKKKTAKCWTYDISQNTEVKPMHFNTPIGGKDIDIVLSNHYSFYWDWRNWNVWNSSINA